MKSKTFFILLALCAVLGIATYMVSTSGRNSEKKQTGSEDKFLSELPVNDIASISVKDAENEVVLEKGESVWAVKTRFGYPADFGKIAEFAKKLKESKVGRTFDATDDTRDRLALHSPDEKDIKPENKGTRVTLKDKAGKVLADVIVGKAREASAGAGGHYLMTVGGKTVYLVDKDYAYMDKKPSDWVLTDLLDVKSEEVREVVCTDSKSGTVRYTLRRAEKGKDMELVNAPADKKLIPSKLNNVVSALAGFKIEDVADPAAKAEDTGTDGICLTFRIFDGTEYSACPGKASKEDAEKYYVRVSAAYKEPDKSAEKKAESPAEAESKPAETGDKSAAVPEKKPEDKTDIAKDAVVAENLDKPLIAPEDKSAAVPESKPEDKTDIAKDAVVAENLDKPLVPAEKDSPEDKSAAVPETKPEDKTDIAKDAVPETKPEDKTDIAKDAVVAENLDKPLVPAEKSQEAKSEEKPAAVPDKAEEKSAPAEKSKDTPVPAAKDLPEDKAEAAKAEDKPDFAKLAADAAELNKKISAWTYMIPKWKAERLITDMEEFFEKPKPEEKAEDGMPGMPQLGMPQPGNLPFQPPAQ